MDRKTPLYDTHVRLGGRIVPFGGFLLPVQYPTGINAEHQAVRTHAGLFDVSHMGEATLEGPDALANLNRILTNRFDSLAVGGCRYSIMLYENGGCVDDLIVYRRGEDRFLLILNAANTEKDVAWIREHLEGDVRFEDISESLAQIALQGPDSLALLSGLCDAEALPVKYYSFRENVAVAGVPCLVSRTGYTGERGYELYLKPEDAPKVWKALEDAGAVPCGLGARDTLRLEAGMPLYGHELSAERDPVSAGLGFAIRTDKPFIGRDALPEEGKTAQVRVGLRALDRGVLREHQAVCLGDRQIGETTSGTMIPGAKVSCAMAYVDRACAETGARVEVDVRGRRVAAEIVPLPFYSRAK